MEIDDLLQFDVSLSKENIETDKIGTSYLIKLKPKFFNEISYYTYSFCYRMIATKIAENKFNLSNAERIILDQFGYVCSQKIDLEDMLTQYNKGSLPFFMVKS